MAFFATEYTIHFDDTMAYGGHHFLTSFKFQCEARETFLFGERIFDVPGVREALDQIHLLTSDAYARNLHSTQLGDRVAIFLTLEEWGRASARFCYRVIDDKGNRVCAGFQTLICANAKTGDPMPMPPALRDAMDAMREIEEMPSDKSFRDRVLSGGGELDSLFSEELQNTAVQFLSQRYPSPQVIGPQATNEQTNSITSVEPRSRCPESWVFAGQGAFNTRLFCNRLSEFRDLDSSARDDLAQCASIAGTLLGGDTQALFSGSIELCERAVMATPALSQVAIHLQNVLGARLRLHGGHDPNILVGHSFGEIAAFETAGCFDLLTGVRIVCLRARAIETHAPAGGGLLAVFAPRHRIETETELLGLDQVYVAGRNHNLQTVASGPLDQLDRLGQYFQSIGVNTVRVPSPTSFHHPHLRTASVNWLTELRDLPFLPPKRTIYSPIGRRFVNANDDVAAVLASQLLHPFDFQGAISDVVAAGVVDFIDCGSTGSLANLIRKALPEIDNSDRGNNEPENWRVICAADSGSIQTSSIQTTSVPPTSTNSSQGTKPSSPTRSTPPQHEEHPDPHKASANSQPPRSKPTSPTVPAVSIVGCGCILPGGASSPEQLFAAITEHRMGIVDQRKFDPHWSEDFYSETLVPDRSTSHLSGRVNDADITVPAGVNPNIFEKWTRSQQLLCLALSPCVRSLEGAERVVCLIGATADGFEDQDEVSSLLYAGIDPRNPEVDARMNTARSFARTPHDAVQEVFDQMVRPGLKVTLVDAACASSLYTVALGMRLLERGQADAVVAGGCFCPGLGNSCLFSQFGGTTSTGCRPFDAGADGVVFSEGAAVVSLRRTQDAERLGLAIDATLRGAGLSSDGRSPSANVPQSNGQILSLERCYASYGIDPSSIHAIEAHGTSTPVGDSTEVETLRQFFSDHLSSPIPIHSLKGSLGHAGWAAGTASIIAACQYMKCRIFPAQAFHQQSSQALEKSSGTLTVAKAPVPLNQSRRRIAVDGFGFGGANAHLVLESHAPSTSTGEPSTASLATPQDSGDELVFVACHQMKPELATHQGPRFDRDDTALPKGMLVLPELADDMDISQTLAVKVASQVVSQLPNFDDQLRKDTSLVLAMSGKTERGVEATTRIMTQRFRRKLSGHDHLLSALGAAHDRARPSRSYTLQCMMPNVAAGRAALLLNINGPNFVVDAGADSLEAAISSASLLLQGGKDGGTSLVVVAAIDASSQSLPDEKSSSLEEFSDNTGEFAAAFGVTTNAVAKKRGWKILAGVKETLTRLNQLDHDRSPANVGDTCSKKVHDLVELLIEDHDHTSTKSPPLAKPKASSEGAKCQIHTPVWVEKHTDPIKRKNAKSSLGSWIAIVPPDADLIEELLAISPSFCAKGMVVVVGHASANLISRFDASNLIAVDLEDCDSLDHCLKTLDAFQADAVTVVQTVSSWERSETLATVASDNSLCEFLFLVAQRYVERLRHAEIELWGLFVDGWNGVVHPRSGSVAGLLKSIHREIPASRVGTLCTRRGGLPEAMQSLILERSQPDLELETVHDGNTRLVRRLRPVNSPMKDSPQVELSKDSVVIASGGARGVTAVMLEALVRNHHCTVIALGRSPLEPGPDNPDDAAVEQDFYRNYLTQNPGSSAVEMRRRFESTRARWEAHQTIEALRELGGRVEYMVVDVTDRQEVSKTVGQIASRFSKVDFLIHGAGVQFSKRLEDRTLSEFRHTYEVKVAGLNHLVESCQSQFGKPVATHVLTSAYSVFGNDGQHDYGAANETMDRLCDMNSRDDSAGWSSLAWLAWDGVGMTRGSEYRALSKQRSLSGVTPEIGQQLFRDVLNGRTGSAINVPISEAEHVKYELKTVPKTSACVTSDPQGPSAKCQRMLERSIQLSQVECLEFHKVRDTPTLPGAWIVDSLVATAMQLYPDSGRIIDVAVDDMNFMRFVRSVDNRDPNLRVIVEQAGDSVNTWMIADVLHPSGRVLSKDVICATARLTFQWEAQLMSLCAESFQPIVPATDDQEVVDPYCQSQHPIVDLSGAFDCLKGIQISESNRSATFRPDPKCQWSGTVPALLLDAAWRVGAMYTDGDKERLFVPVKIGRMTLPVNANMDFAGISGWTIRSTSPKLDNASAKWGRTEIVDQNGTLRMLIENASATRLN